VRVRILPRPCAVRSSSAVPRLSQPDRAVSTRADIYARPDLYDMEYEGASNYDAQFFARLLARVRPRRVLELACGSGRVTFTLAAALPMAEIVGVDSSIDMLAQAAAARDGAEPSVRERVSIVEGDMREWPGRGSPFDAVVIACCSVSQLLTLDDRRRTWATAFRLLRPGGACSFSMSACPTWPCSRRLNACDRGRSWIWTSMPSGECRRRRRGSVLI
jgi:ubiquinone/menaquinone biosynthesis C-methylase UbiE